MCLKWKKCELRKLATSTSRHEIATAGQSMLTCHSIGESNTETLLPEAGKPRESLSRKQLLIGRFIFQIPNLDISVTYAIHVSNLSVSLGCVCSSIGCRFINIIMTRNTFRMHHSPARKLLPVTPASCPPLHRRRRRSPPAS